MKNCLWITVLTIGLLLLGERVGLVGFHYPLVVENEPLLDPIGIARVEGDLVTLDDGRVLATEMEPNGDTWENFLATGKRIDLEKRSGEVLVYANRSSFVCGTPWARPIRIPLIADKVYRNRREVVSFGSLVEQESPDF